MSEMAWKTTAIVGGGFLLIAFLMLARPGYLTSPGMLGAIIVTEVVFAALCRYRKVFFTILVLSFLFAGTGVPFEPTFLQARWHVLCVGAVAGVAIYMKNRDHYFSTFHLVAFFCLLSAFVSALVSAYPEEALLKAMSLVLLFVYGASGARLAIPAVNPANFFRGLLVGCEVLTYVTAVSYFVFRWEIYGSVNSLGAVMGIAVVPITLWGFFAASTVTERRRRGFGLLLAMLLLMSSFSRASIGAAAVSSVAICIVLHQYRTIAKGIAVAILFAVASVMVVPVSVEAPKWNGSESVASVFLYKGKGEAGVLASRQGPWDETWKVIRDHPWFGSGFGTSLTGDDLTQIDTRFQGTHVDTRLIREHGNSYLAIAEWVGLMGVVPFYSLVALTIVNVRGALVRIRHTRDVRTPLVPLAAVVLAALVHAGFEDWMFAVGNYICVFFWALAFILVDVLHAPAQVYSAEIELPIYEPQWLATASGQ
jgi:O-antigen ligase